MMHAKHLALTATAVLMASLLLLADNLETAFAVTAEDFTLATTNNEVFYMEAIEMYVVLHKNTVASNTANITIIDTNGGDDPSTAFNFEISPMYDGCNYSTDLEQNNPCNASGGTAICNPTPSSLSTENCEEKTGVTGFFGGLWCGLTDCFVLWEQSTGGYSSQLLRVQMTAGAESPYTVGGYMNITSSRDIHPYLWGYDEADVGIGGVTVYYVAEDSGSSLGELYKVGGTLLMGEVDNDALTMFTESGSGGGQSAGMRDLDGCRHCGGVEGVTRVVVSVAMASGTSRSFISVDSNGVLQDNDTPNNISTTCTGTGVSGVSTNTAVVKYLGDTVNKFAYVTDTGIITYNVATNANTCHANDAEIVNYIRHVEVDEADGYLYITHGSGSLFQSLTRYSLTLPASGTALTTVNFDELSDPTITGWVTGGMPYHHMAISPSVDTIILVDDTSRARLIFLEEFFEGGGAGPADPVCIDLNGDGTEDVCYEDTNSDGVPDSGGLGAIGTVMNQNPIYSSIGRLVCQVGATELCTNGQLTDTDIKTNGTGALMWLMLMFALLAIVAGAHTKEGDRLASSFSKINVMLYIIIIFGSAGIAVAFGWIEPLYFWVSVFVVIGLASVRMTNIVGRFTGGGGDGSE